MCKALHVVQEMLRETQLYLQEAYRNWHFNFLNYIHNFILKNNIHEYFRPEVLYIWWRVVLAR